MRKKPAAVEKEMSGHGQAKEILLYFPHSRNITCGKI